MRVQGHRLMARDREMISVLDQMLHSPVIMDMNLMELLPFSVWQLANGVLSNQYVNVSYHILY